MHPRALLCLVPILAGCMPEQDTHSDDDQFADGRTLVQNIGPFHRAPRVDMILVIDDSPSMRPFAANWVANLATFAKVMEAEGLPADIRIAITTTSVPGPTCSGPRALGGEPVVDSCRAHLDDFVGPDEHAGTADQDLRALCEDACSLSTIPRVLSLGSDDHDLHALGLRPWIEPPHNPFGGNLDGVSLAEALTCAGLQGFGGCEYESPIEAAARMVEHLDDPSHPMSAFRRPDSTLVIITIGDEDDCSHPDASATIFDPDGARTFWPDPTADVPNSAICIQAGLECDAEGCELTDHALDGTSTDDPSNAVLTPTSRLRDALVAAGEYDSPDWVPIIANVGGYNGNGAVNYTVPGPDLDQAEQQHLASFGVLPVCLSGYPHLPQTARASPAGRLAAAGDEGEQYSICGGDWSPALEGFATRIREQLVPSCVRFTNIHNLDPSGPVLTPDCVAEQVDYQGRRTTIPTCLRDESGWAVDPESGDFVLPSGVDMCWTLRTDPGGLTSAWVDDLSVACVELGLVAEPAIRRRPGTHVAYDTFHELRCRPSDD